MADIDEFERKRLVRHIIYGPIHSRRLGSSLGINVMPEVDKLCTFDCVYCECGFSNPSATPQSLALHDASAILSALEFRLQELQGQPLDSITFSGNGEPTLHPQFPAIIDGVISLRDRYCPSSRITVLSNSTTLAKPDVFQALRRIEMPVMKLDSAVSSTLRAIDLPRSSSLSADDVISRLCLFHGNLVVQTILISGSYQGRLFDNTTPDEVQAYLDALRRIKPRAVMLYALDRKAPVSSLTKMPLSVLQSIAQRIRLLGIDVSVSE